MFSYVVTYFDEFDKKTRTEKGLLSASTYGAAADRLVKFYGKDSLITLVLTALEDILTEVEIKEEFVTRGEN